MEGEPDWCEERVLEILPDLNCTELGNLCLELGLTVDEKIKGNRTQVYKFIMKHFLELEAAEGEHGIPPTRNFSHERNLSLYAASMLFMLVEYF